jgi:NAD(P)-dependent dehydrogenase (short-subunit alcohol dehydrogenase family)
VSGRRGLQAAYSRIDLLINNAGIMRTPEGRTAGSFERQLGTNLLGHFVFTGLLLNRLAGIQAAGAGASVNWLW